VGPIVCLYSANRGEQKPGPQPVAMPTDVWFYQSPSVLLVVINAVKIICSVSVDAPPFHPMRLHFDRLCGLMVRVPGYRTRGPGSIPTTTRFSKQ
jgi:hypothetical protein